MPVKKQTKKTTKKTVKRTVEKMETTPVFDDASCCGTSCFCKSPRNKIPMIIGALTLILLFALAFSKGYILVAIVNNKPLFRFQLNQTMMARYGKQTLEGMVSESLIADEAKKLNITISQEEIDAQEAEVLKSFGGKVSLDELLKFQGTTKTEFDAQIKLQLVVNKIMEKDIAVTDEEIAAYKETNKTLLVSSDEASLTEEARKALTEQKINEKIQPWFTELKNKAKIFKFLQ
jgi:foldase protein PrsA